MSSNRVQRAYEARAPFYNAIVRLLSFGGDGVYRRAAVARLQLRPGDRVLDVGCGTGLNFRELLRSVGKSGRVVGTDAYRGMLRQVVEPVHLVQATASQCVFKEATFDAVLCTYVISTILGERVIEPMVRVLKPGGHLVVVDDLLPPGWYVGPGFMLSGLWNRGWPDLRRETERALAPYFRDLRTTFCHGGMIFIISGVRM